MDLIVEKIKTFLYNHYPLIVLFGFVFLFNELLRGDCIKTACSPSWYVPTAFVFFIIGGLSARPWLSPARPLRMVIAGLAGFYVIIATLTLIPIISYYMLFLATMIAMMITLMAMMFYPPFRGK